MSDIKGNFGTLTAYCLIFKGPIVDKNRRDFSAAF